MRLEAMLMCRLHLVCGGDRGSFAYQLILIRKFSGPLSDTGTRTLASQESEVYG